MRFQRLVLERYGHFTDAVLDFRPAACLHVVYGPNEAGKTSCLSAIDNLLFGFESKTDFAFLHDKNKLVIGATIEAKDGSQLSFKRRKGIKQTLLDLQNNPLKEDSLLPFIGQTSRSLFLNAFGLSKETLRQGAEDMLKSGGELGASLIAAASGLRGLTDLRSRLAVEASNIFTVNKSQQRTFYQARERFESAAKQIRERELKQRDLKERLDEIRSLSERLISIREQRLSTFQKREFLERQREIGPLLHAIAADENLLQAYEYLPLIDSSRVTRLREALNSLEEAEVKLTDLRSEEAGVKTKAESFVVNHDLINLESVINALIQMSTDYDNKKGKDRNRVHSETTALQRERERLCVSLGLAMDADLSTARPSDIVLAQVKELIERGIELTSKLSSKRKAIQDDETALSDLEDARTKAGSPGDPRALKERLARITPTLSKFLPEITRLEQSTTRNAVVLKEAALQLSPSVTDLDALAILSVPTAETIAEFASATEALTNELVGVQSSLRDCDKLIPELKSNVGTFEQDELESTPEKIEAIRTSRNNLWKPLRATLLSEVEPQPVGVTVSRIIEFEMAVEMADRLADNAVDNADRIAKLELARKRLSEQRDKRDQIATQVDAKTKAILAQEEDWQMLWKHLGFSASKPSQMQTWRSKVVDLLQSRSAHRNELQTLSEYRDVVSEICPPMRELAHLLEIPEAETLPTAVLHDAIKDKVVKCEESWNQSQEIVTLITETGRRIKKQKEEFQRIEESTSEWKGEWQRAMSAMGLQEGSTIRETSTALDLWKQAPSVVSQLETAKQRVKGMDRDTEEFESRVAGVFSKLGEPEPELRADAAIKFLSGRLSEAKKIQTLAAAANEALHELRGKVVTAENLSGNANSTFASLCAGLPETSDREKLVNDIEDREDVLRRLRDRRQTLIPLSRGKSEAELQSDLATFDETAAVAEIAEMRNNETQLNQDENKTYSDLQQKQRELEALENGVGAEIALQQRRNAEAKLTSCTREWAVKRIAEILLSHAIDQYRNKQEQPLLNRAGELFSLLTADRFVRIEQAFDDSDNLQLVGRRNTNETVTIEGMSEGTQDQLYLALRLAYLEDYAKSTEPIPFIGDDLLTSFDDERTRRGLAALAATGDTIQPILFTHHSKVVELAQSELGAKVDVIMLQPN